MLGWLRGRAELRRTGHELYERIVAQARQPALYEHCSVPDTMDGRLEMILLHVVLVLDRLKREGSRGQRLGQQVMERMVADIDDALRRIGLGDDSVAGRLPRLGAALAERVRDYGPALAPPGEVADALETAFLAHIYRPADATVAASQRAGAGRLAAYARQVRAALAETPAGRVLAGQVAFAPVMLEPLATGEPSP